MEDFPGNLCPDRAQPRYPPRATPYHATLMPRHASPPPRRFTTSALTCVCEPLSNARNRVVTRNFVSAGEISPNLRFIGTVPVTLDQPGETNLSIYRNDAASVVVVPVERAGENSKTFKLVLADGVEQLYRALLYFPFFLYERKEHFRAMILYL